MENSMNKQLKAFLSNYKSVETVKSYKSRILGFLNFLEAKYKNIEDITEKDVFEFTRHLNKTTASNKITAIKQYYHFLTGQDLNIDFKASSPYRPDRYLSFNDAQKMIHYAQNLRDKLILKALFETGIRINELVNLTKKSIKKKRGNVYYLKFISKGNKQREIQINQSLAELLINFQSGKKTLFGIGKRQVERIIKQIGQKAFNKVITPHCFRHGFATELMKQGVSFENIKQALGHENIVTTLRYLHNRQDKENWNIDLQLSR